MKMSRGEEGGRRRIVSKPTNDNAAKVELFDQLRRIRTIHRRLWEMGSNIAIHVYINMIHLKTRHEEVHENVVEVAGGVALLAALPHGLHRGAAIHRLLNFDGIEETALLAL